MNENQAKTSSSKAIQANILQRLNALYETNFHESAPAEELCSAHSLSRQELEIVISPLLAEGWVEKDMETLGGYHLRFTCYGKREFDKQSGNHENEAIRESILRFLAGIYEANVNTITSSDDIASNLGLNFNKICLNLQILEQEGSVELKALRGAGHPFYLVTLTPSGKLVHDNPAAKLLFLSHAAVDEGIAMHFKEVIEATLPGTSVFVSSDPEDLRPGDPWVEVILDNLKSAKMVLVLATQRGLSRKWVWYESGAAWSRGLRIVPCCVGNLRKGELPAPFSRYQALNVDEEEGYRALIGIIAGELGVPLPEQLDASTVLQKLRSLNETIQRSNVAYMPPEEIQHRVDAVELRVRIDQGLAQHFVLLVENESTEEVLITEVHLESKDGHRLTAPARPGPGDNWMMEGRGRVQIAWQTQRDPAVELLTLHQWPEFDFETDFRIKFLCKILGKPKWCSCTLRVQVGRGSRMIRQLVG